MLNTRFGEGMGLLEQRFGAGIKIEWVGVGLGLGNRNPPDMAMLQRQVLGFPLHLCDTLLISLVILLSVFPPRLLVPCGLKFCWPVLFTIYL